jgi:hypothetical protein
MLIEPAGLNNRSRKEIKGLSKWKDEDIATPELIREYLKEFREGVKENPQFVLSEKEKLKVQNALSATERFCLELLASRKCKLYMHDLILMAVGFYGGYLTASDTRKDERRPNTQN